MNNKVYINPKFNRPTSTNLPPAASNNMHVNPKFSQHMLHNNSRIYVNPHFIKLNANHAHGQREDYDTHSKSEHPPVTAQVSNTSIVATSKSRYSLVRHNATQALPNQTHMKATTIKLNKYKSVAICDFKKILDVKVSQQVNNKPDPVSRQPLLGRSDKTLTNPKPKAGFQYAGRQISNKNHIRTRFKLRNISLDSVKSVPKSSPYKLKPKTNLKKNNIPCPLFKKYGKCLRSIHGICDFLHDKKHVSICRKFMKGICHDSNCLLSHDVTSKKMPTCNFYLKGMCSKENCPYVHVKLNEKAKVCSDFLKGYCEKGDKCLNRHVDIHQGTEKNKREKQVVCSLKNKKTPQRNVRKYKLSVNKDLPKIVQKSSEKDSKPNITSLTDTRYYKEVQETSANMSEPSEVIKPTRCKLGTLPSFIKL
ncbi:uncharacterized protein LOC135077571 [Ostrinia nubilalis]|uniref:uncharacterized protein LOC114364175 n=1 Tax=Ostrinia furnacalis TaxID=93504 RepID=UPI00103BE6F8|nr:uncharacterized protein LOC114364175 [Ostrinia furnacalis]